MRIHLISTVNGEENEGMRNIATHISRELSKDNNIIHSSLHDLIHIPLRCKRSECTLIFARCISRLYNVIKICSLFTKNIFVFIVQQPDKLFIDKFNKHPLNCNFFYISEDDIKELYIREGFKAVKFNIGINSFKFHPVDSNYKQLLRKKYGLDPVKPLIIHVGHCSSGRGLEDFHYIDTNTYQCMVVASGMFDDEAVIKKLKDSNIRLHFGYISNINEIYQMADAYFFPTNNDEYVISVPLSVMEALACGIPVLAYSSFRKILSINSECGSIKLINDCFDINSSLAELVKMSTEVSYLVNPVSWNDVANEVFQRISMELK